ncbi:MAG: UDP-N-acetylmuramate dehydrogenase [Oscillospiraceae bacterium]|jgi:UDP-N-acetylmuramate dehydrogenase|nr:UDP-N-acetylmuramate dehydrogenase [Oscillospiraceae bacterium]
MDFPIQEIKNALPELKLLENEPLREHCSFKIGGAAKYFALPKSEEELAALVALLNRAGCSPLVIGAGTNLLVTDEALDALVVRLGEGLDAVSVTGGDGSGVEITAGAGITLARLAAFCAENALAGLAFAHGIPGTLGGGIYMNAGAYGGELKDLVQSVKYLTPDGSFEEKSGAELNFSYRHSAFTETGDVIVSARLRLKPGDRDEILANMRALAAKRRASQPLEKPSAGSTFKRPEGHFAAALIEQAGLKGFTIGGAQVSEKHAGFVINSGGASFNDVRAVMTHVQETVMSKFGVALEPEVRIIDNR